MVDLGVVRRHGSSGTATASTLTWRRRSGLTSVRQSMKTSGGRGASSSASRGPEKNACTWMPTITSLRRNATMSGSRGTIFAGIGGHLTAKRSRLR